jgi:hypothetical protein
MAIDTVEAQARTYHSGWRIALKLLVIVVGLVLGVILGAVGALYTGLITISC